MKTWLQWGLLTALVALLGGLGVTASTAQEITPLDMTQYELDNGLQVILVKDDAAPTVAVDVWYRVGGANDPEGRSGFAHLFEHMMFQGSDNVARSEHFQLISAAGGRSNASTARDRTNYFQTLPAHQLPLGLWLEADRMASLVVDENNFNRERNVVIEEYRQRYENRAYGEAILKVQMFPYEGVYRPYEQAVIGDVDDLNESTVEEVRDFHDTYYTPNNATLVVAGDFDEAQTRALIDEYFGSIPAGAPAPALPDFAYAPQDEAERVTLEDSLARVPAMFVSYVTVPRINDDYPSLDVLARVLGRGASSRLAQALIDTGLASSASASAGGNLGPGLFNITLVPNPGVELTEIEDIYYAQLERIRTEGVDAAELEKVINQIRTSRILGLQSALGLAESVHTANFFLGDPNAVFEDIDRYTEVTSDDIQRVIETYLGDSNRHVIEIIPVEGDATSTAAPEAAESLDTDSIAQDDRPAAEAPPEALPVREFNLPQIDEVTLDNGLEVVVVPQSDLPVLGVQLVLPGGASAVSDDLVGLADFTAALLTRGTETRSAQEIAAAIEQVGGSLNADAGRDRLSVSTLVLSEHSDLAFDLMTDVIFNPTFPEDELATQRQRALTSLQSSLANPRTIASRAFNVVLYGEHPYGNIATEDSYNAITRDDIVSYYESQLNPDGAVLIVTGDITTEEAVARAQALFGDWETPENAVRVDLNSYDLPDRDLQTIYLIDRPGSTQVDMQIGHLGIEGANPERRPLQVANNVLGGGASSRLFLNLREREGYTYGIYSGFNFPRSQGTFSITASVRAEVIEPAIRATLAELDRLLTEPVPQDELEDKKSNIIGNFALNLETALDFAGQIASLKMRDLPLSELRTYPEAIASTTQDDVLSIASQYIRPQDLAIVVVGDAGVIRADLENIAPVVLVDENGQVVE